MTKPDPIVESHKVKKSVIYNVTWQGRFYTLEEQFEDGMMLGRIVRNRDGIILDQDSQSYMVVKQAVRLQQLKDFRDNGTLH
jgi:hypothetical protein